MTQERWNSGPLWMPQGVSIIDLRGLGHVLGHRIEIADTGSVGSLNEVRHGLNRVPAGVRLVNKVTATGNVDWYRQQADPAWDDKVLSIRFTAANCRVLLEVF